MTSFLFLSTATAHTQSTIDNRIPVDELDNCWAAIYCISEPGYYYLRDSIVVKSSSNLRAIRINSDNVTLDLNGFAIISTTKGTYDGIRVIGNHNNIVIKNGIVRGFGFDGIYAEVADGSTFKNLRLYDNDDDGLNVGDNCLVVDCFARNNGRNGIRANKSNIIRDCTSSYNGWDGFTLFNGTLIYNSISHNNSKQGIEAFYGCRVEACTVFENSYNGIRCYSSILCLGNTAYRNGEHGIDGVENILAMNNVCNENGVCISENTCLSGVLGSDLNVGAGIRVNSNSVVQDNECVGNYFGIAISDAGSTISNNKVQHNKHAGIITVAASNIIIQNKTEGNGFSPSPAVDSVDDYPLGEIVFGPGSFENCSVGPIYNVSTSGDISTLSGADHPFANFIY